MVAKPKQEDDDVLLHYHNNYFQEAQLLLNYNDMNRSPIDYHHQQQPHLNNRKRPTFSKGSEEMTSLPMNFTPSDFDVILGTGREARDHVGNNIFQQNIIKNYVTEYFERPSKLEKGRIISEIIQEATNKSPTGTPFVKRIGGKWYAVGYNQAREKVSQSLRNELRGKYRSSLESKKHRRKKICNQIDAAVHNMMKKRGNYLSTRIQKLETEMKIRGEYVSEGEIVMMFTQANIDILEALKQETRIVVDDVDNIDI